MDRPKVGQVVMSNKFKGQHAQTCFCQRCMNNKLHQFRQRMELMNGVAPPDMHHTIPVRPHWRVGHNHLKNANKEFRENLMSEIREAYDEARANRNKGPTTDKLKIAR